MNQKNHKMNTVVQNVILGSITGVMVGYNLRLLFIHVGATDLMWILFFVLGPLLGYLSGKERQRMDKLKKEKYQLEENLDQIQQALQKSARKYRLLVEHANDAIYLTTMEGRFLLFNDATSLFSGYTRNALKRMNISQLRDDPETPQTSQRSWVDNGTYRYEENWKTRIGEIITMEVNARWIQVGGHKLILHVGRDVCRQRAADQEEKAKDIKAWKESKLLEMASIHRAIFSQVLGPLNNTIKLMNYLLQKYPQESENLIQVMAEWKKTRHVLQGLPAKNARDISSSPTRWNINEILKQEIHFLETTKESSGVIATMNLTEDLAPVFGFGRDFSLAFGTLFNAAFEAFKSANGREFRISSRPVEDSIYIEIRIEDKGSFGHHLCSAVDPFHELDKTYEGEETEIGIQVMEMLFDTLGAQIEIGHKHENSVIIVQIPTVQDRSKSIINDESAIQTKESVII